MLYLNYAFSARNVIRYFRSVSVVLSLAQVQGPFWARGQLESFYIFHRWLWLLDCLRKRKKFINSFETHCSDPSIWLKQALVRLTLQTYTAKRLEDVSRSVCRELHDRCALWRLPENPSQTAFSLFFNEKLHFDGTFLTFFVAHNCPCEYQSHHTLSLLCMYETSSSQNTQM